MRYLTVQNFGTSLGVEGARLVVREHDGTVIEESLSRLRGIRIAKKGVSISSNLILECAARGIRIFLGQSFFLCGDCPKPLIAGI